ncbi:MAG TPA: DEAD/DEAH box helicase family protein, partial [bacterium]|nr:DEAD/DEAH box helicase family protein [bacterium]
MGMHSDFPGNPYKIIDPSHRWIPDAGHIIETAKHLRKSGADDTKSVSSPSEDDLDTARRFLIPPLVNRIRQGVKAWRDSYYSGASETTRLLLNWWFNEEHVAHAEQGDASFQYYFAQREAVESALWLYEIEKARDSHALLKYDELDMLSKSDFCGDWTRYVFKLATGAGKTKVMSLLIAWSYFHKLYEEGSELSQNFLVVAPNIIVLERL